uniref:Uracil phosphoribosyltransferase n=1 Tax=Tanacetum cinerariifolium TaxID=118510 RepID=A0A6L2MW15_TANCI|nr:uracil phosphoribosyltransferase [Tanacetum cinerariifolium]
MFMKLESQTLLVLKTNVSVARHFRLLPDYINKKEKNPRTPAHDSKDEISIGSIQGSHGIDESDKINDQDRGGSICIGEKEEGGWRGDSVPTQVAEVEFIDPREPVASHSGLALAEHASSILPTTQTYHLVQADLRDGEVVSEYAQLVWELHSDQDKASTYFIR